MIAAMERAEIVFLRSEFDAMVKFLHDRGVVHIEEVPLALENHPGYLHRVHLPEAERAEYAALQELQQLLKESLPLLAAKPSHAEIVVAGPTVEQQSLPERRRHLRLWHRQLRSFQRRRLNAQESAVALREYARFLEQIAPLLSVRNVQLGETASVVILKGYSADGLQALKKAIVAGAGPQIEFLEHDLGGDGSALVIVHPADRREALTAALQAEGLFTVSAPDKEVTGTRIQDIVAKVQGKLARLSGDIERLTADSADLTRRIAAPMFALDATIQTRIAQLEVNNNFAQSELIGVIHGWVPSDEMDGLCSALQSTFGARVAVGTLSKGEVDLHRIPTLLKNAPIFKPFEIIMSILKPATYGSFDPTSIVAIGFIFFYGFIVGDIGYGLSIMAVAWWAKNKFGHINVVKDAMVIFNWMGMSAIFFGIIYAEFFGDIPDRLGIHAIFHRSHETSMLLALAVLIGLVHIPMSLAIAIREGYKHHHTKHAEEKLGLLLGLVALLVAGGAASGFLPLGSTIGFGLAALLFAASVYYLIRSMGAMAPMGVIELVGLSANILSYGRLMALGVAAIAFADIANNIPAGMSGPAAFFIGVPAALAVHLLNIGISVFSPTIHSLRLNFVEFLPKFYENAGRTYQPFRKDMAW